MACVQHPDVYERALLGTRAYVPLNASIDLWSLGVTIYHASTGRLPFQSYGGRQNKEEMSVTHFTLSTKLITLSRAPSCVESRVTTRLYSAYVLAVCIYYILCLFLPVDEINKSGGAKKTGPLAAAIVKRVADISYSGVTIRLRHAGSFLMMTLLRIYCCITAPF